MQPHQSIPKVSKNSPYKSSENIPVYNKNISRPVEAYSNQYRQYKEDYKEDTRKVVSKKVSKKQSKNEKKQAKKILKKKKDLAKKQKKKQVQKKVPKRASRFLSKHFFIGGLFGIILGVSFLGHPILVDGQSMMPNFEDGELIYTMNLPKKINRFDVVIVKNDNTARISQNELWIKRVIGLPGETIEFKNGNLYVNDKKVKQTFTTETTTSDFGPVTLGKDEYWVMGDNRDNSCDSRYVGTFKRKDIKYVYCFELPWCPSFLKNN